MTQDRFAPFAHPNLPQNELTAIHSKIFASFFEKSIDKHIGLCYNIQVAEIATKNLGFWVWRSW
jgi:hypothetical protein